LRVVGFDCAEEEHVAVLLGLEGEQERQLTVQNRGDRIQECLAKVILAAGAEAMAVVVVESKGLVGCDVYAGVLGSILTAC
jgi:hypothetical protein